MPESRPTSRIASLITWPGTKMVPVLNIVQPFFRTALRHVDENPHIVRAIAVLPLLITWFVGLHKKEHRSAAYRGFLLSAIFLLGSWILYWIIDLLRTYLEGGFVLQLTAFTLQGALSLVYIGLSIRLAIAEYRQKELTYQSLDRLLEMI